MPPVLLPSRLGLLLLLRVLLLLPVPVLCGLRLRALPTRDPKGVTKGVAEGVREGVPKGVPKGVPNAAPEGGPCDAHICPSPSALAAAAASSDAPLTEPGPASPPGPEGGMQRTSSSWLPGAWA